MTPIEPEPQAETFAKYHAEYAAYGGASAEFHARAETFIREQARALIESEANRRICRGSPL
jgi:hypothetical protein